MLKSEIIDRLGYEKNSKEGDNTGEGYRIIAFNLGNGSYQKIVV